MRYILLFLLITDTCRAQFQYEFTFANRIPGVLDAPIFGPELAGGPFPDWADAKSGNTLSGMPPGNQTYKGSLLEGWTVSFFAGVGELESGRDLWAGSSGTVLLGSGADAGYFSTITVRFDLPTPGGTVGTFQVRIRNESGIGPPGASALFTGEFGGISTELRSFNAGWLDPETLAPIVVPEPRSMTLVVGGAVFFLLRKRRMAKG